MRRMDPTLIKNFLLLLRFISPMNFNANKNAFNPFVPNASFLYPLKTSKNVKFCNVFMGLRKSALGTNGLSKNQPPKSCRLEGNQKMKKVSIFLSAFTMASPQVSQVKTLVKYFLIRNRDKLLGHILYNNTQLYCQIQLLPISNFVPSFFGQATSPSLNKILYKFSRGNLKSSQLLIFTLPT